ncbi:MAG: M42 family peptidase, partial [Firmicutes bacterium]|nr:M42 family peptidase [Bacillota bacterium]
RVVNREGAVGVVVAEDGLVPKDLAPGKLAIDLGVSGREAAEKLSAVGDVFCPAAGVVVLGDLLSAPALDDRAGCAVLVETARRLAAAGCPNPVDLVFSVQGAIGPRGARPAAHGLGPALALVVDLAAAQGVGKGESRVEVGKGPALRVKEPGYVAPPRVRELLLETARAAGLPCQVEVAAPEAAVSDAGGVELAGNGVMTGVIGLPARLPRGLAPAISLADLESTVRLLVELLSRPLEETAPWVTRQT